MKRLTLISSLLICIGCSGHSSQVIPKDIRSLQNLTVYSASGQHPDTLILRKQQVFDRKGRVLIGQIGDVAVDNRGRVYIADSKQRRIFVFSPSGVPLDTLGRKGKGPGEFTYLGSIQIDSHKLFARNIGIREEVFSLESMSYLHSLIFARNKNDFKQLKATRDAAVFLRNNGTFLMEFVKSIPPKDLDKWESFKAQSLFFLLNKHGNISSKLLFKTKSKTLIALPKHGRSFTVSIYMPFVNILRVALSTDNHIYTNWTMSFLIKVYSPNGTYQRAFYYPYKKVSLTKKSALETGVDKYYVKNMAQMDLPDTWPAIYTVAVDAHNRLWVATIVKNMAVYQWWILDKSGKLLARFRWPRSKPIVGIKNGCVYTIEKITKAFRGSCDISFK